MCNARDLNKLWDCLFLDVVAIRRPSFWTLRPSACIRNIDFLPNEASSSIV
jgi:hypothetical protein